MFSKRFVNTKKVEYCCKTNGFVLFKLFCPPSGLPNVAISRFYLKSLHSLCLQTKVNGKYKQCNGKYTTATSLRIQLIITSLHRILFL